MWSYYETGSVACPACGGLRSVGVDERTRHTDGPAELDLSSHRTALEDQSLSDIDDLKSDLREYVRRRGFIAAGDLRPLDETFLAAYELLHAVDVYARLRDPNDDERLYVLDLLRGADSGERPAASAVPKSMRAARGLGSAEAVDEYRRDGATWLDDNPHPTARRTLGSLAEQVKRVRALQGDVDPATADALVRVAREVSGYLREGDESALAAAQDRLTRI